MNEDAASLDRLHDIVIPPPIPWWPPAPGWYVLAAILVAIVLILVVRFWSRWRADAYRREALRSLDSATDIAAVAALLRRTALAESPRAEIAALNGNAWVDWLAARSPEPVSPAIREQLVNGSYAPSTPSDLTTLRAWAARWIAAHHVAPKTS